ncbi:MAG: GtrA family protein [Patescibacteria group bacterium]
MASTPPQFLRFIGAGSIGVVLYYLVLCALTDLMGVWYIASAIAASIVNFTSNFLFHKKWTFRNESARETPRQALLFFSVSLLFVATNAVFMYALVEWAGLWYLAAQGIVTIVLTFIGFFTARWIFKSNPQPQQ